MFRLVQTSRLSGYGQRAGRALAWLLSLVVVLTVLLVGFGLPDTTSTAQRMTGTLQPMRASGEPQDFALEVRTLPALLPSPDRRWTALSGPRASLPGRWCSVTPASSSPLLAGERLLGLPLIALIALAIRARVKR